MAQFVLFESNLHSLLQLDEPIPQCTGCTLAAQSKGSHRPSPLTHADHQQITQRQLALGPEVLANLIPRFRPPRANDISPNTALPRWRWPASSRARRTSRKMVGGRPPRRSLRKLWALNMNGFDVEEAKILRLSGKPQNVFRAD